MNIDLDKLQNIVLVYDLPFALDLKNCLEPEDDGEVFTIIIDDIPAQLTLQRVYSDDATGDGLKIAPFAKIKNDRYGFLSKSKIKIYFDHQIFNNLQIDRNIFHISNKFFFQLSLKYLNKFLMNYRSVTREYWIRPLKKEYILLYRLILLDSDKNQRTRICFVNNTVNFNDGKEITIPQEQENHLRNLLLSEHHNLADDLLLNALDNIDLGNYNNTIIQCSILFENYIYSSLESKLSKTKLDKIKRNDNCNCLVGMHQVCKTGLKLEFDSNFGESEEFNNFHQKVLKIRNDLVHGNKLENVEYKDAEDAIAITLTAINKLKSELNITK